MEEHQIDLSSYTIRTDLALEAHQIASENRIDNTAIPGVRKETATKEGITTSWIWIDDAKSGEEIGKHPGTYLTLEIPGLRSRDSIFGNKIAEHFAEQFQRFLREVGISDTASALLVGLGNWNVTPDALGPLVIKDSIITRHLFRLAPEHVAEGYRDVSALQPGVLGITGIETSEIVQGVVEKSKPDFVIAFDSLASRSLSRVNTTIQVADTGINPGSGIGNKRKALNKETLGVPVIAVGVPTVVDAVTVAHDTIDFLLSHLSREMHGIRSNPLDPENRPTVRDLQKHEVSQETSQQMMGMLGSLDATEKRQLIHEVLSPLGQNLIVTPKEIDSFISHIARIVSNGVNCALHETVNMDNVSSHLH